jgi:imidazolonepropionase-like amidohydrolase
MRALTVFLASGLLAASPGAASAAAPAVRAILGATVVDPVGGRIPDAVVLLTGNRITQVGPRARVKVPDGAERLDGTGRFLIPGLIDAHVHFFQSGGLYTRPDAFDLRAVRPYAEEQRLIRASLATTFERYLRSGVTSVADVGGPFWNFEVRAQAAALARAPRVAVAGPLVSSVSREALDLGDPPIIRCATPAEARALVAREAERKPDFMKIWYVVTPVETVEKNRPVVRAAIEEAHRLGYRMAVHATELEAAKAALQEGADILVHSVMDVEVDEAFLALARARRAIYVPTLIVSDDYTRTGTQRFAFTREELAWGDPFQTGTLFDLRHLPRERIPERLQNLLANPEALKPSPVLAENLRRVARAGIPIAMGTDAGNIGTLHGPSVFRELRAMEEAGLSPLEVLRTATVGGAAVMGRAADLGRVAPGFLADLVLLDADPALSTSNLSRIHLVVRDGLPLEPATLAPDGPEALAQRQLNAFNAHDLEAFAAPYDPEVEVLDLSGKVLERGTAALQARYRQRFEAAPGLHCELVKRMAVGDWVVDEERITGAGPQPVHALSIYEVKGGKIARVRLLR